MIKQEGVISQQQSPTENLVTLKSIQVSGVRVFDSFLNFSKKCYEICCYRIDHSSLDMSQEKQSILRYVIQGDISDSKQRKSRKGSQKNLKNDHIITNLLYRQDLTSDVYVLGYISM